MYCAQLKPLVDDGWLRTRPWVLIGMFLGCMKRPLRGTEGFIYLQESAVVCKAKSSYVEEGVT